MAVNLLPLDVFAVICGYLDPNDVLKLAFVNKSTYNLVNTRTVWIDQLLAVIHENGLYAPSFPLRKMSICELMQTACGPGRMIDRFWAKNSVGAEDPPVLTQEDRIRNGYTHPPLKQLPNSQVYELPFISRHDIRCLGLPDGTLPDDYNSEANYDKICLIPGGRFLACVAGKEVFIWDLGLPAQSKYFTPKIYCRWTVTGNDIFMPAPSADGKEIRLVVGSASSTHHSGSAGTVTVYRIWEQQPAFSILHHGQQHDEAPPTSDVVIHSHVGRLLKHPREMQFFTVFGDLFICIHRAEIQGWFSCYVVTVWDFMNDTYASWKIATQFLEAFVDNGFLCMMHLPAVVGWKIPPLKRWKDHLADGQSNYIVPPSFSIVLGGPLSPVVGQSSPDRSFTLLIGRMLDWYNILKPLRQFDGIVFNEEGQNEFWTYGVYDWPDQWTEEAYEDESGQKLEIRHHVPNDPQQPPYVRLRHVTAFVGDVVGNAGLTIDPYRICEGYTVKNVVSGDSQAFIMVEIPERPSRFSDDMSDDHESIHDVKRPRRVISLELDVPCPILPPRTAIDDDDDDDDDNQNNVLNAAPATTTEPAVDPLAVELGELTLGYDNLTLPLPNDLRGRTDFSFDPCSGRFCYISAGRQRIGVVEFLKWG